MTAEQLRLERELFVRALMPNMHGEGADRIAAVLEAREVPEGTWLFHRGDPPDEFFFIVEGHVVMEAEGHPDWTFGDRSLVGMVDMTAWRPHRRSCRTTRATRLLVGRSRAWLDIMDDDPVMGDSAIYFFSLRVHTLWTEVGHLLPSERILPDGGISSPLAIHEKTLVLRDTPLLARARTQAIASLAQVSEELTFGAGSPIFAPGQAERALYAVASGVVELLAEGRTTRVGPQRFLAAAAALCGRLGDFSARAATPAILLRIREEDYYDQSDEHPELTRAAMAHLALQIEELMDLKPPVV